MKISSSQTCDFFYFKHNLLHTCFLQPCIHVKSIQIKDSIGSLFKASPLLEVISFTLSLPLLNATAATCVVE